MEALPAADGESSRCCSYFLDDSRNPRKRPAISARPIAERTPCFIVKPFAEPENRPVKNPPMGVWQFPLSPKFIIGRDHLKAERPTRNHLPKQPTPWTDKQPTAYKPNPLHFVTFPFGHFFQHF
jgi:hypothetical protein